MSGTLSRVSSLVAVALSCAFAPQAFGQAPPGAPPPTESAAPPPAEPAAAPPPTAQQSGAPASVLDKPGFDFGLRLGYALPMGDESSGSKLSDGLSGAIPIVLEAGYRINGNITVGALFQYGFAQVKDNMSTGCGGAVSCSGSVMRLGIEGIYNFNLDAVLTPWVGIGTGYEWLGVSLSSGGQSGSASERGFEFLTVHVGGDYKLSPQVALGPFLSFSLGEYSTVSASAPGLASTSMDISNKAMHEWLQIGVRGKFGI
jgi:hypothetical protein